MLNFPACVRIFVALKPCDMRKSFNGLYALAQEQLEEDPREGALFLFSNKPRTLLKILYFDGSGLWVLAKRLEKGTFTWPQGNSEKLLLSRRSLAVFTLHEEKWGYNNLINSDLWFKIMRIKLDMPQPPQNRGCYY